MLTGIVEEAVNLRADDRVHRIERTEHHDIIRLHIRVGKVELIVRMILVEQILRIVVLIKKRQ